MKLRILLANRDHAVREAHRWFLEGCGYDVETAVDGVDCLEKLIERSPAVLVMEQELLWGGADGVIARMREDWNVPFVPIVLLAGDNPPEDLEQQMEYPVVVCLRKPYRLSTMLRWIISTRRRAPEPLVRG